MDPAFEGGAISYDDEMATMDAEMGDLLDIAHIDLETFYLFSKTVLERVAQYVELYFGPEPKLSVRTHEKLRANFDEYTTRRGVVVPDELRATLDSVHENIFAHQADSATNDSRQAQSPSDLMMAHTENRPGPNGATGAVTQLSLTTGQLVQVVDAYLRSIVDLVKRNPNRARLLRKRKAPAPAATPPAAQAPAMEPAAEADEPFIYEKPL
jgi:hypothetical protein